MPSPHRTPAVSFLAALLPLLPLIAASAWLGLIISLLVIWLTQGSPRYKVGEATVAFISDVGAANKTLFVTLCCVTAGFYIASLLTLYFLRQKSRFVPEDVSKGQKWAAALTIVFALIGTAALILLSIFDAFTHNSLHWIFTIIFIVAISISAICNVAEVRGLKKAWSDRRHLRVSAAIKVAVVVVAISCGITIVGLIASCGTGGSNQPLTPHCDAIDSAAAVLEWVVAFIIAFYFYSFVADMWPATYGSREVVREMREERREAGTEMEQARSREMEDGTRNGDGVVGEMQISPSLGTLTTVRTIAEQEAPYDEIPNNDPYKLENGVRDGS